MAAMRWDIFCRVIDNFGDVGVCWRLSAELARRGEQVRLWLDDPQALAWMAPGAREGRVEGIEVLHWTTPLPASLPARLPLADVWIEAFGCEPPASSRVSGSVTSKAASNCTALAVRTSQAATKRFW